LAALILVEISLPTFNHLLDKTLTIHFVGSWKPLAFLVLLVFVVGLLAGSYPAFYLSAFQPVKVLKGTMVRSHGKTTVRNLLVIIQFSISIFLIVSTLFVYRQLEYVSNKKLGFNKEHVLIIPMRGQQMFDKAELFKTELRNLSFVTGITSSRFVPGRDMDGSGFIPEGYDENNPVIIFNNEVDPDFVRTMQMDIVRGRDFSREYSTDTASAIINETLARKLGWEEPINKKITGFRRTGAFELTVVGVARDYHFRSLHDVIEPGIMFLGPNNNRFLIVRLAAGDPANYTDQIRDEWKQVEASMPFDYYFLNEDYDRLYQAERRVGEMFLYFTIIAIIIACLGLFGLASYNAEQKRKEIGIRKALGSSVGSIVLMLSKQFSKWVVVANVIAWPLAWLFMHEWLGNFAYGIRVIDHLWIFVISALTALVIALLTVAYQAVRAALINPVDAIKYE
jgi:putative ABC transport system permease protein